MKLNLGCADRLIPGFIGVDTLPTEAMNNVLDGYQQVDLAGPWPWETSSVEEILAYDVIEHIGDCAHGQFSDCSRCMHEDLKLPEYWRHPLGRIHFLNELHRVLKPGAHATIETPNAARGVGYIQDPTHVSPWCMSTFKYFEHGSFAHQRLSKPYGITAAFRIVEMSEHLSPAEGFGEQVWKIKAILEAVK